MRLIPLANLVKMEAGRYLWDFQRFKISSSRLSAISPRVGWLSLDARACGSSGRLIRAVGAIRVADVMEVEGATRKFKKEKDQGPTGGSV